MAATAIRIEHLGKKYLLSHERSQRDAATSVREAFERSARNFARRTRHLFAGHPVLHGENVEEFWALDDVSFEVRQGETVAIVGRNGAGKSTLLKVLSRITEPTRGRVTLQGRVASLLEVGTGFHPELTGRENIFLNGAILGMSRAEIQRKFDEIVAFAEVERFLDTPVKRYSSGMYVRLAFSVAAHLEPEILIVDEVLAVGDAAFQKKCLGKMGEVSRGGRTVLFVSHNMAAIENLCQRAVLLEKGKLVQQGATADVLATYSRTIASGGAGGVSLAAHANRKNGSPGLLTSLAVSSASGGPPRSGEDLVISIDFDEQQLDFEPEFAITIETSLGQRVFSCATYWLPGEHAPGAPGTVKCVVQDLPLMPGVYAINVAVGNKENLFIDHIPQACSFEVVPADFYRSGKLPSANHGTVLVNYHWV